MEEALVPIKVEEGSTLGNERTRVELTVAMSAPIAIATRELNQWGCPHCGYRSGSAPIQGDGCAVWSCGECQKSCVILADGMEEATMGFANGVHPKLQPHPRAGTPSHGRPDTRPEGGGEWFNSRGLGTDVTPGCFICEGPGGYHTNISGFVQCKEAGERVVAMFGGKGAWLDYRERYPDRVQVKVGACKGHKENLERLHASVREDGILTEERLKTALA